ncbi:hypothetical protein BaRGS_00024231 [Batillaria attramentaria]|uniref:Uncharacterized protein n=1 Tax=Batillaria attramentaria TaxID=370345 RepID=A0ABD0KBV2_9CAEN
MPQYWVCMPLVPGDTFRFHHPGTERLPARHTTRARGPTIFLWSTESIISEVRYFMIGGQVDTTYVNFAAGCETENES